MNDFVDMATAKKSTTKGSSSSGSDPKSKRIVKKKMEEVMHEFKEGDLSSGNTTKKVRNPKQAIAIGLSEARKAGAKIPVAPAKKKGATPRNAPARKKAAKTSSR